MNRLADRIIKILTEGIDREVRMRILRTYSAALRDLEYLLGKSPKRFKKLERHDWSVEKLEVAAALSAFAKHIVGPIQSASDRNLYDSINGPETVVYGRIVVDSAFREKNREMVGAFESLVMSLSPIPFKIHSQRIDDLIFSIESKLAEPKYEDRS